MTLWLNNHMKVILCKIIMHKKGKWGIFGPKIKFLDFFLKMFFGFFLDFTR